MDADDGTKRTILCILFDIEILWLGKIFKKRLFISIKHLFSSCFFHELFTGFEFVVNLLLLDLNTNERQHIVRTHQQGLDGLSNYGENFRKDFTAF